MKKNKAILFSAVIVMLFSITIIGGCKKTEDTTATCTDGIKNGTETGIDCGGSCGACISDTYYPLTAGTVRVYKMGTETITDSVTSKDTLIGGITYRIFHNTFQGQVDARYVRNSSGSFYVINNYGSNAAFTDFSIGPWGQDVLVMKENVAVGNTWIAQANGGFPPYVREVMETGITLTVGANTFNNVCVLHQYYQGSPSPFDVIYYAKGVGFIKALPSSGPSEIAVTSYTIN